MRRDILFFAAVLILSISLVVSGNTFLEAKKADNSVIDENLELQRALACDPQVIGINNRDLTDFSVSLETTRRLRPLIPDGTVVVSESCIHSGADVERLADVGVDAVLVGEALVTADDTAAKVRELSP